MDQGGDLPHLAGQLHKAGARPAAQVKDLGHEEAGGEIPAVPGEVVAQNLFGGGVGPDEIGRGVVVVKALEGAQVKGQPHGGIGGVAVAPPGLVVPKEHQHHRLVQTVQVLGQLVHGGDGLPHPGEIVVPDVAALLVQTAALGGDVLGDGRGGPLIGAVVLIGHGEGEAGAVGYPLLQLSEQLVGENIVGVIDGAGGVHQIAIVVLGEPAVLKAQIAVHVLAVIEPAVARVAEKGLIALVPEVPHIGVGVPAEVVVRGVAGQKAPLAVHRAPGEDVGQQPAGHALVGQLMPLLIYLGHGGLACHKVKVGQVAEGLQHNAHDGHLLVRRDVLVGKLRQHGLGRLGVIPRGRRGEHVPHAV